MMGHMTKRNVWIIGLGCGALGLIALMLLGNPSDRSNRISYDSVNGDVRFLWNPEAINLEEWQILISPADMEIDQWGQLIIADTGNSRIVRINPHTLEGQIIGTKGQGPNEFISPNNITLNKEGNGLWVYDKNINRITCFKIDEHTIEYQESYRCPFPILSRHPSIAILSDSSYVILSKITAKRMVRLHLNGDPISEFGETLARSNTSSSYDNSGWVYITNNEANIIFVGEFVPVIEKYDVSGTLVEQQEFIPPELTNRVNLSIETTNMSKDDPIILVYDTYFTANSDKLYIIYSQTDKNPLTIYRIDVHSMKAEKKFITNIQYKDNLADNIIPNPLAIIEAGDGIVMYAVDMATSGLFIVHPTETEIGSAQTVIRN